MKWMWSSVGRGVWRVCRKQTRSLRLQVDGKLWVKLDSGPLKEELMMAKGKMVDLLNEELGRPLIKEIVIQ